MASPKDPQQFCVRWNSYQSNLQSAFPKLLTNEHFVDVTLACESRMVKCHKVVLSACSAYFEKLLVQNPCQHPIIFMKDMKYWEVQALVDFMYKGEVNVTQDELASLLKAAEALEVRGLCGQQDGQGNKLLPRGTEAAAKKRRADENVGGKGDSATPSAGNGGGPAPPTTPVLPSQFGGGDTNGAGDGGSVGQAQSSSNPDGSGSSATEQSSADPAATGATPTSTPSDVKQECMATPDNGLFEDFDDDFYQDDNSLQIDETGNAYSLTTPNVQLDCSPTDNREMLLEDIKHEDSIPFPLGEQQVNVQWEGNGQQKPRAPYSAQQPYKQYTQQSLERAIYDLQTGKFSSVRACARHYGIPMTTLRYRAKIMSFITKTE
ncbi:BTB/POZ domain [Nesidiocoris tenuis]|uniref:BTB/POZ domain n=1 Tax=Nesidiocoris tenuis TaxID=355587 RepID=A0ABN7A5L1_9HEMI|nr:BTB/POZ domain [Nesidiocoris tenuis]